MTMGPVGAARPAACFSSYLFPATGSQGPHTPRKQRGGAASRGGRLIRDGAKTEIQVQLFPGCQGLPACLTHGPPQVLTPASGHTRHPALAGVHLHINRTTD